MLSTSEFSLYNFMAETMPEGVSNVGNVLEGIKKGAIRASEAMDDLAEAFVKDYQNAAACAKNMAENAYARGYTAAGELYDRMSESFNNTAAERYSMSGNSYVARQAVKAAEVLGEIGSKIGAGADLFLIGKAALDGIATGDFDPLGETSAGVLGRTQ
jgi:hypothetical protein